MNILIIGGSGFLSGTLARQALIEGHQVWGVTRGSKALPTGVHPIVADRNDRPTFAAAIAAAKVHWDLAIDCIAFNADHAKQDLEVLAGRVKHLVMISTDSTVSAINRPWRIDETYDRFEDSAPYGMGKRAMEIALLESEGTLAFTILRPGHIYGPGSLLGCLPMHGRDSQLIHRLRRGEILRLVGGGHFLQSPTFAEDLWDISRSCMGNEKAIGQIYFAPGPDVVESRVFYRIIAEILGVELTIEEASITEYLQANPTLKFFCCHRVYSGEKARAHGVAVATTPIAQGLRRHVEWAVSQADRN
jgi:nucleoside-diphosphate-sugar epimerase